MAKTSSSKKSPKSSKSIGKSVVTKKTTKTKTAPKTLAPKPASKVVEKPSPTAKAQASAAPKASKAQASAKDLTIKEQTPVNSGVKEQAGKPKAEKSSAINLPAVQAAPVKPVAGKPVAGKPAAGKPTTGKPVAGKALSGKGVPAKNPANPLAHIPSVANGSATLIYAKPIKGIKPGTKPAVPAAPPAKVAKPPINAPIPGRPVGIVPAPIPADAKPRKNQAGFSSKELEQFRQLLLEKRAELLGDMRSMEHEALRSTSGSNLSNLPVHMADMGTDNYEQEFTLGLVEKDRLLLREINVALQKILDGSYGICEGTGKPINAARLEVRPWTRYSIDYARKIEQGLVRPARRDISG